jgi:diaminopimelate decarboxylase
LSYFQYRDGVLHAEGVALPDIAAEVGAPTYVYSASAIEDNYHAYADAFAGRDVAIHFALKANGALAVVSLLAGLGAGADIVSLGELRRALKVGMTPDKIVFSGVGKTRDELTAAVSAGIAQINIESAPELDALDQVARKLGKRQPIAIRVNPDVDAHTHEKISTGKRGDKFGVPYDEIASLYRRAANLQGVEPVGLAVHIGSQLTDLAPYRAAYGRLAELVRALRASGLVIKTLDLGGGIGVQYNDETPPSLTDYATIVQETLGDLGCHLAIEPGRSIVASAGILLSQVIYRKAGGEADILILDSGMNDLMRPSLYGAYHPILPVKEAMRDATLTPVDVVGPVCETGDIFARGRLLPPIAADELVAIGVAGAYGASMSSTYNARPLAAEILVRGGRFDIIRHRQTIEALFADERVPDWLKPPKRKIA